MNSKYNSIKAETIEAMENGAWKIAWSVEEEKRNDGTVLEEGILIILLPDIATLLVFGK